MALRLIELLLPETDGDRLDKVLGELQAIDFWQQQTRKGMTLLHVLAEADHAERIIELFEKKYAHNEASHAVLLEVKASSPAVEAP